MFGRRRLDAANLILYVKSGCHLCEEARTRLAMSGLQPREIDIMTSLALFGRYRHRVPVLATAQGRVLLEGRFDDAAVRRLRKWVIDSRSPIHGADA